MVEERIKLKTKDRDALFKKEFAKLKIKVTLNWFELIALFLVAFFGTLKVSFLMKIEHLAVSIIAATLISIMIVLLFTYIRKYQLKISRFDKEHIYKQISADLIEQSKSED